MIKDTKKHRKVGGLTMKYRNRLLEIQQGQVKLGGKPTTLPYTSDVWRIRQKTKLFIVIEVYGLIVMLGPNRVYIRAQQSLQNKVHNHFITLLLESKPISVLAIQTEL